MLVTMECRERMTIMMSRAENEDGKLTVLLSWALVTTVLAEDDALWGATLKVHGKLVPKTVLLFPSCH